jgi:hypothetical protein
MLEEFKDYSCFVNDLTLAVENSGGLGGGREKCFQEHLVSGR